jgi:DeoR/GlpR family transcriptional regulator of sugar metabolism
VIDPDELSPAQEAILDMLRKGRVTAPFAAEETGYSLQYCREQLTDLTKHDLVRKVYDGLYELVDDPREEDT